MPCYRLESCDPGTYPNIESLFFPNPHPFDYASIGVLVYVDGDPNQYLYKLVFVSSTCKQKTVVPKLVQTEIPTCAGVNDIWIIENCETGERRNTKITGGVVVQNNVYQFAGLCGCWKAIEETNQIDYVYTIVNTYSTCVLCMGDLMYQICGQAERTIGYAVKTKLPKADPPDRGFSKCCYTNLALADSSGDPYKNDFYGLYFKRNAPADTCTFKLVDLATLVETTLNSSLYGTFQDFGGSAQPDLKYFIADWSLILSAFGEGKYRFKKELNISGVTITQESNSFVLKTFSIENANGTARIDANMDGLLVKDNINFKNTGFQTSIRVRGFFGRGDFSYTQDNISTRDYNFVQNTMSAKRDYRFQGNQLPECITDELFNFVLFGNELFISDYNGNNHSYKFEVVPVKLEGNEGIEYSTLDRAVNVNLTFSDRYENNRKFNC